jgi:hypothetical protein
MDSEAIPPPLNDDPRSIALWAADCAERALPIFEATVPGDTRPRAAILAIRAFVQSGERTAALRRVAWAAHAAAREVGDPAATAAARAASTAAGSAYTHPIVTPHQINHILSPAAYAALAIALRATDEPDAGGEAIRWAIAQASPEVRQVVKRLTGRVPSKGRFHALLYQLDAGLRR